MIIDLPLEKREVLKTMIKCAHAELLKGGEYPLTLMQRVSGLLIFLLHVVVLRGGYHRIRGLLTTLATEKWG